MRENGMLPAHIILKFMKMQNYCHLFVERRGTELNGCDLFHREVQDSNPPFFEKKISKTQQLNSGRNSTYWMPSPCGVNHHPDKGCTPRSSSENCARKPESVPRRDWPATATTTRCTRASLLPWNAGRSTVKGSGRRRTREWPFSSSWRGVVQSASPSFQSGKPLPHEVRKRTCRHCSSLN